MEKFIFTPQEPAYTPVYDSFIRNIMPQANGSYVKVYLYLLYYSIHPSLSCTPRDVASALHMIESDVLEAIRYFERHHALHTIPTENGMQLIFTDSDRLNGQNTELTTEKARQTNVQTAESVNHPVAETASSKDSAVNVRPENAANRTVIEQNQPQPKYSPEELNLYSQDIRIKNLFAFAQGKMGSPLSHSWLSSLYGFYDYYRLPFDVIEYLIEYCLANNHRSLPYWEKIAQNWSENNIHTRNEAQIFTRQFDQYIPVLKALGASRFPTKSDREMINRWLDVYQMPMNVILEACKRSQSATNTFTYAEGILSRWHQSGIHSLQAVQDADALHQQQQQKSSVEVSAPRSVRKKNAFLDYDQRKDVDYDALERELANLTRIELQKGGCDDGSESSS